MTATVLRWAGSALAWYVLPAFAVLTVVAYIAGAVLWHANPPAVPVAGISMKPTLQPGDLVFLKGVDPKSLRVGDIIAVHVPKDSQSQYSLPGEIAHRIVKIQHSPVGPIFHTKGDANSGPDVFVSHSDDVIGRVVGHAPGLGYPLLFLRSTQGKIFIGVALLVAIAYFGLGLYEDRRVVAEGTAIGLQSVLAETQELKAVLAANVRSSPWSPPLAPMIEGGGRAPELERDVSQIRARAEETTETVRQLVGAIGEYGTHLRSHTAVMQNLAATTAELQHATAALGSAVAGPRSRPLAAVASIRPPTPAALPLNVPLDLARDRAALDARTARVDELLRRFSAHMRESRAIGPAE